MAGFQMVSSLHKPFVSVWLIIEVLV